MNAAFCYHGLVDNYNILKYTFCGSGEHFRIEQHRRGGRSDSVLITPNLIKNLQKNRKRIIAKGGSLNVQLKNVHKKKRQHFKDIFTTAIGKNSNLQNVATYFLVFDIIIIIYIVNMSIFYPIFYRHGLGHNCCCFWWSLFC